MHMDDVLCIACPMREHPGGSVQPGDEDIKTTRQIVLAGQILEIEVLDHLIVAQGVWVSLREQRLGGWEKL